MPKIGRLYCLTGKPPSAAALEVASDEFELGRLPREEFAAMCLACIERELKYQYTRGLLKSCMLDEVLSTAMLRLTKKLDSWEGVKSPRTYLSRLAFNAMVDVYRGWREEMENGHNLNALLDEQDHPYDTVDALLHTCVDDTDANILKLRVLGLTVREIGAQLDLAYQTVARRLQRLKLSYEERESND
jgi:RNA polymerase sigma factor (sigma-70 family)